MQKNTADAMKEGMRRLPSGVSIITAKNDGGERFAMTASSVTSVSDTPASLLVCVNDSAALSEALRDGALFGVNVLSHGQQNVSIQCSIGARGEARFDVGEWRESAGVLVLRGAEASFICKVDKVMQYGTHHIVVGLIEDVLVSSEDPDPLVYHNGAYRRLLP